MCFVCMEPRFESHLHITTLSSAGCSPQGLWHQDPRSPLSLVSCLAQLVENCQERDQSNSTTNRVFALHMADLGSFSSIPYGLPSLPRVIYECSQEQVLSTAGWGPKTKQITNKQKSKKELSGEPLGPRAKFSLLRELKGMDRESSMFCLQFHKWSPKPIRSHPWAQP